MQAVGRGSWDGRGQVGDGELESEIWAEMGLGCDRHASVCGSRHVGRGWGGDVKVKVMACGRRDGKVQDGGFEAGGIQHHRWSKRAIGTTA